MDSALSETERKLEENGSYWDNVGNYMGILSVTFFMVTILQILAIIWDSLGKNVGKSNKSVSARDENEQKQNAETTRIYEALEKLAKVSISNNY
ncbi:hypothetical protein DAPPUDRAFT_315095 [Daphnia pulex]|uniref:Uncharacterized protein n=1 Tax=Daphnia pulex TaxID=6669 RepID=E9G8P8_DAPPU|nr:hypothetical protein DAPPUDRAFT_315095 [Daphnia pulex]|eukprot:EFX84009.1 hypothetical protein DAPPUDRAFT_315095 [Daphnia pulex]